MCKLQQTTLFRWKVDMKPRMDPNGLFGLFLPSKSWSIAKPQRHPTPHWKPKDRGFTLWIPAWLEVAFCIPAFCHDKSDGGCKQEMVDAPIDGAGSIVQAIQTLWWQSEATDGPEGL